MTFESGLQQEPKQFPVLPVQPSHLQSCMQDFDATSTLALGSFRAGPASDPATLQCRMDLMAHWADESAPHAAPVTGKGQQASSANHGATQSADQDAWWRFTHPAFAMPEGKHDVFQPVRHFDTGYAALNLPMNILQSLGNLAAIPVNALSEMAALPEDVIRAAGGSEQHVQAANFTLMMAGLGEVNMATEAIQGMRAASELNTLGKAAESSLVGEELAQLRLATPELESVQGSLHLASKPSPWYKIGHSAAGGQIGNFVPQMAHQVGGPANPSENPILRTLQIFKGGWDTNVVRFRDKANAYEKLSLPTSGENAAKAIAYHRVLERLSSIGEYDVMLNSCSSNARNILQAGGMEVPFWARSPELLKLWFKMKGAK